MKHYRTILQQSVTSVAHRNRSSCSNFCMRTNRLDYLFPSTIPDCARVLLKSPWNLLNIMHFLVFVFVLNWLFLVFLLGCTNF